MWNIFWRMISVPRLRSKSKKTATKNITVLLHRPVKHRSSPGQKWSGRRSLPLRRRIRGYVLRHGSSRWKHSGTEDWFFTPQYGLADMVKNRPEPMKFAGFRYHGRKAAMKKVSQRYTEFLQVYLLPMTSCRRPGVGWPARWNRRRPKAPESSPLELTTR